MSTLLGMTEMPYRVRVADHENSMRLSWNSPTFVGNLTNVVPIRDTCIDKVMALQSSEGTK